nr:unnamed protein product [Callosobruchus chinensis]
MKRDLNQKDKFQKLQQTDIFLIRINRVAKFEGLGLTLLRSCKAQIRPSLEYCSHIWGAATPITLSILDAVQRRAIRLVGDPALTCHLQPLSHRRGVGDLSLFYRYLNEFCSSELASIIPPFSKPAKCIHGTSSCLEWTAW